MHNKTLNFIKAKLEEGGKGSLEIYGDISDVKFWEEDVTPLEIKEKLKDLKDCTEIDIHINSYGGSVFAGLAIIGMLNETKAYKTAYVEGIAASMASVIAASADKVVMTQGSMLMIHKPLGDCYGNADEMRKTADLLDKVEQQLISVYMTRFSKSEAELSILLKDETFMTFEEAKFYGLADEIQGSVKIAAYADKVKVNNLIMNKSISEKFKQKGEVEMEFSEVIKAKLEKVGVEIAETDDAMSVLDKVTDKLIEKQEEEPAPAVEPVATEPKKEEEPAKVEKHTVSAEADETLIAKAKAYDEIKSKAVENACKCGVQAMGETFAKERWEKIFDTFNVDEINAQAKEWEDSAKKTLNAGVHATSLEETVKATIDFDNII